MSTIIPFVSRIEKTERQEWLAALRAAIPNYTIEALSELTDNELASAQVAIVANPDPAELKRLPNLVWVQSLWAGVERMVRELPDEKFKIVRMTDPQLAKSMAEAVLAWVMYLHRDMPRYRRQQNEYVWKQHQLPLPGDRTIGILGLGNLGNAAALKLLEQGFNVCGWSRSGTPVNGVTVYSGADGLHQTLARSDILVILLPLTRETHGLLNDDKLQALPSGASIINFARGPILDSSSLIKQLDSGHLDHAVLDVFEVEPLPIDNPLWSHPDVTVLPHISAPTNQTTASTIVSKNIEKFIRSGEIPNFVNIQMEY